MVVTCGEVATFLASLSVPTFTDQRSVPHANAAEADASIMIAPKTARRILFPPLIGRRESVHRNQSRGKSPFSEFEKLKDTTGRMPRSPSQQRQRGHEKLVLGSLARENEHNRGERGDHGEVPKHLHGLAPGSGKRLDQSDSRNRPADHPEHRRAPDLIPRRQMRELHLDEVDIVLNAPCARLFL
jgi:hypothetical protein